MWSGKSTMMWPEGAGVSAEVQRAAGHHCYPWYGRAFRGRQKVVARARKIQKFLSQPFHVAEVFTGIAGKYVPLKETIRGFKMIVDGEMDEYPENAFFNVGTIDEVVEKAKAEQ